MIKAIEDLQKELCLHKPRLEALFRDGKMSELHAELNYIAALVGQKHSLGLSINFPERDNMDEVMRGERNISIIFHPHRKEFLHINDAKEKAASLFVGSHIQDFERAEGFHILFSGGKVSVFAGSIHLWCNVKDAEKFVEWAMKNVYGRFS